MLSENQFKLLAYLEKESGSAEYTQREIAESVGFALGKTNQLLAALKDERLIDEKNMLTENGRKALEPYRVKNAVIMAAGMSTRFAPLSYEKPKALMEVKGELLIEREIRQLQEAGIHDIILVTGYMKEKLFYLADKFGIDVVVNEDYYRYNNTSTIMRVLKELGNTYICSSDNYFTKNPFEKYVYRAYYSAVYAPGETDEYCLTTARDGRITKVDIGGRSAWYMLGHVYWDREFSRRFTEILKNEYEKPATKQMLWEDLYIQHIKELDLYIRKYDEEEIKEFDSLDELRQFDESYWNHTHSAIFKNICGVLHCEEKDIEHIHPIKTGLTNLSFFFTCKGKDYVYRHPGVGTNAYINRESEARSMETAGKLGLDDTFIYMDAKEGWKISYFVEDAKTLDYHNEKQVKEAMRMLRRLHTAGVDTGFEFDIWKQVKTFEETLRASNRDDFTDAPDLAQMIEKLRGYTDADGVRKTLCHADSYDPNFLIGKDGKMYLIDWEYSGMADPAVDLGTFIACSDYSVDEAKDLITTYFDEVPGDEVMRHYMAYAGILSYYWFVWSLYQDSVGKTVGEWMYLWYRHTKMYGKAALAMYETI